MDQQRLCQPFCFPAVEQLNIQPYPRWESFLTDSHNFLGEKGWFLEIYHFHVMEQDVNPVDSTRDQTLNFEPYTGPATHWS